MLRLAAYLIAFSTVIAVVITAIELGAGYYRDLDDIDRRMRQIEAGYLDSVIENLWVNDRERLDTLLLGITRLPDFVLAEIRVNGLIEMRRGQVLSGGGQSRTFPLWRLHQGKRQLIGELTVAASYEGARHRVLERLLFFMGANGVKTLLVALFILFLFHRLIGRHLEHMARFAHEHATAGDAHTLVLERPEPAQPDELSALAGALNQMRRELLTLTTQQCERADLLERELAARLRAESGLHLMASVFANSRDAILITDAQNRIVACNEAFSRLSGYRDEEVLGQTPRILASGLTPPSLYRDMWDSLHRNGVWHGELWDRRKDGEIYPKWASITAVRNLSGELTNYIAIFTDISERKLAQEQIYRLAHYDSLTGLRNRLALNQELRHALVQAAQGGASLAVLILDLDHFKEINDVYGHAVGDQLLVQAAQRVAGAVRDGDVLARLGGDEFVVVLPAVADREAVAQIADKIRLALEQPYLLAGKGLRAPASIGIALFPADADSGETLMKHADTAMYQAKTLGRNKVQFYAEGLALAMRERVELAGELRQGLALGQFTLHYQPQYEGRGGRLVGLEALVRWHHPAQGLVPPARFIPVAEQTGLILPLGEWILDEACRQIRVWREREGGDIVPVAVNLSAQQLNLPSLVEFVAAALRRHGLPGTSLELEITESMLMHDIDANIDKLKRLRAMGVKIAIDDFGTGYSSLSYLRLLPIDALKLDRTFVHDIETDDSNVAICVSTITLAHNLGLTVVAEGVETEVQREFLAEHGCDVLQGYLLGRPLPAEQIGSLLAPAGRG